MCRFIRSNIIFIIVTLIVSCSYSTTAFAAESGNERLILGVPFYAQKDHQCGPAALAGVLNFYGLKLTPEEIAESIYSPSARGTLDIDMIRYAEKKGLQARRYRGNPTDLKNNLDKGRPLIILVDYGFFVYRRHHYLLIIGYSDDGVIVPTAKDKKRTIPYEDLLGPWERAGFWTLLIAPKAEK
jgi:ABC-type bacteriocin/lantibiotic exporter with double-glycine peptidase domain